MALHTGAQLVSSASVRMTRVPSGGESTHSMASSSPRVTNLLDLKLKGSRWSRSWFIAF